MRIQKIFNTNLGVGFLDALSVHTESRDFVLDFPLNVVADLLGSFVLQSLGAVIGHGVLRVGVNIVDPLSLVVHLRGKGDGDEERLGLLDDLVGTGATFTNEVDASLETGKRSNAAVSGSLLRFVGLNRNVFAVVGDLLGVLVVLELGDLLPVFRLREINSRHLLENEFHTVHGLSGRRHIGDQLAVGFLTPSRVLVLMNRDGAGLVEVRVAKRIFSTRHSVGPGCEHQTSGAQQGGDQGGEHRADRFLQLHGSPLRDCSTYCFN